MNAEQQQRLKRLLDLVGASVALALGGPAMLAVAVATRLSMGANASDGRPPHGGVLAQFST